ncbi:MAG: flagellar basal body P-ring biosynthesis protein [Pseudomonadota bacterium]|jgi:flagella basal body P-ring formation protein FlgA|uniref:Flagellar basal body P-ring formation chaperone FlgA n=1 Tax=Pseudaquabacterium rugosum TaxID=2984194 RepID=A0ABU9B712_9BURK|nr:flagellar basal body P-ring formation protein FlgA [Pseudomonadota bacterium]
MASAASRDGLRLLLGTAVLAAASAALLSWPAQAAVDADTARPTAPATTDGVAAPLAMAPVFVDALHAMRERLTALPVAAEGPRPALRVEVEPGRIDPRLRLAPCRRVEPWLPRELRLTGAPLRIGLRCVDGPVRWNVHLPVTVRLWGPGLAATADLPAGTVLQAAHLRVAEVDWAARPQDAALVDATALEGRVLGQALAAGTPLHRSALRARRWFEAGETVRVRAHGGGYEISAQARALGPGVEDQPVQVKLDNGRIVRGTARAAQLVELAL